MIIRIIFTIIYLLFSYFYLFKIFSPIFEASEIIIPFGIKPFDICYDNPLLWKYIQITFIFTYIFSNIILINIIFSKLIKNTNKINFKSEKINQKNNSLNLLIGKDIKNNKNIYLPELSLYQNILITGTIGTGKTSSAMYPFTEQIIKYNSLHPNSKIPILLLDVKGNYFSQVKKIAQKYNLEKDIIEMSLNSNIKYNPLHKPNLTPIVLANRLKTILLLFSENNSESYWIDKAEQVLTECIKLCRLYNNGYVTFTELHKLITEPDY